jgi:hypothetical protein
LGKITPVQPIAKFIQISMQIFSTCAIEIA